MLTASLAESFATTARGFSAQFKLVCFELSPLLVSAYLCLQQSGSPRGLLLDGRLMRQQFFFFLDKPFYLNDLAFKDLGFLRYLTQPNRVRIMII